jgi:hypothetical protein
MAWSSATTSGAVAGWHDDAVLLDDIAAIGADPLTLAPGDMRAEDDNTVWLWADVDERRRLSAAEVVTRFDDAAERVHARVEDAGYIGAVTFYAWHDRQAGQLRCSVATCAPTALPFGGAYGMTSDLAEVVAAFLADTSPGVVPFSDLQDVTDDEPDDIGDEPFAVWAAAVGNDR